MSPDLVTFRVTIPASSRTVMLTGDKVTWAPAWEEEKVTQLGTVGCVFNLPAQYYGMELCPSYNMWQSQAHLEDVSDIYAFT